MRCGRACSPTWSAKAAWKLPQVPGSPELSTRAGASTVSPAVSEASVLPVTSPHVARATWAMHGRPPRVNQASRRASPMAAALAWRAAGSVASALRTAGYTVGATRRSFVIASAMSFSTTL